MKQTLMKLCAVGILAMIALIVAVVSTFAWYSMSGTPEAGGMQLSIGSAGTLSIAPDMTVVTEDGVVHYPGRFSDSLNLSSHPSYGYLQQIESLAPVSTADGVHWFFPSYYEGEKGEPAGLQGSLRDISDFMMDDSYSYANLSGLPSDDSINGSYVMLDFWVMAPMDCSLRVSYGDGYSGSYAVSLPYPVLNKDGNYVLPAPDDALAAAVRVGFLADTRTLQNASMYTYVNSDAFDDAVHSLRGVYREVGETWDGYSPRFAIYEPNGNYHSEEGSYTLTEEGLNYQICENGSYVKTQAVGYVDGDTRLVDVTDITAVQTATRWLETGDSLLIQQIFETFMLGESNETDVDVLYEKFCARYLGYQCDAYIEKGEFIKMTEALKDACGNDGIADGETVGNLTTAGAVDDVVIVDLQRNVPQRIRMFVWVEGQDVDCSNVLAQTGLLLRLELAGDSR